MRLGIDLDGVVADFTAGWVARYNEEFNTDIQRDGTMRGPNIEATKQIAIDTGLKVIASGGVSALDDIRAVKRIESFGIEGVIVGKALYERRFTLAEAINAAGS